MRTLDEELGWLEKRASIGFTLQGTDATLLLRAILDLRDRVSRLEAPVKEVLFLKEEAHRLAVIAFGTPEEKATLVAKSCEHVWSTDFVAKTQPSTVSCKLCGVSRAARDE